MGAAVLIVAAVGDLALAQTTRPGASPQPQRAAPNQALPQQNEALTRYVVKGSDCQRAVEYRPPPGVEYQPGVDVRGRPVRSADVDNAPRIALPDEISFNLTVRLSDYLTTTPRGLGDTVAPIGKLTVRGGQVLFNDQPLSQRDRDALVAACREAIARGQ